MIRTLAVLFHPILPFSTAKVWNMLDLDGEVGQASWDEAGATAVPAGHKLGKVEVLFKKIEDDVIEQQEKKLGEIWEAQS